MAAEKDEVDTAPYSHGTQTTSPIQAKRKFSSKNTIKQWKNKPQRMKDNALLKALDSGKQGEAWALLLAGADIKKTGW